MKKVLCTILALAMLFAVCVMPAYADEGVGNVKLRVTATPMESVPGMGSRDVYKVQVYLNSEKTLSALDVGISYDDTAFDLLKIDSEGNYSATGHNEASNFSSLCYDYQHNVFWNQTAYDKGSKGRYTTTGVGESGSGRNSQLPWAYTHNQAQYFKMEKSYAYNSASVLDDTLINAGKQSVHFVWKALNETSSFTPPVLFSGTKNDSMGIYYEDLLGEQEIFSFLLAVKPTAPGGTYTVGIDKRQVIELKGRYSVNSAANGYEASQNGGIKAFDSKTDSTVTFENATIKVDKPAVERKNSQVKFTWNNSGAGEPTLGFPAQFRAVSKISDADWKKYFFNTGKSTENNCLTELGFVVYTSDNTLQLAKWDVFMSIIESGQSSNANYTLAKTEYVKHTDGSDAEFALRVTMQRESSKKNMGYISYAKYKDASGTEQTIIYTGMEQCLFADNCTQLQEQYKTAYPYKA